MQLEQVGQQARESFSIISRANFDTRQAVVYAIADELHNSLDAVIAANQVDITQARRSGLTEALIDRLTLNESRLTGLVSD